MSDISYVPTKTCKRCKRTLALTEFRKQSSTKDGLQYDCKACTSLKSAEYYEKDSKGRTAQIKEWQKLNPDKVTEAKKRHYEKKKHQSCGP